MGPHTAARNFRQVPRKNKSETLPASPDREAEDAEEHWHDGGRGPFDTKSPSIWKSEGQPMTNFDLSEDKFVRQPSGRRWSAPVSEHGNEAPRWASLTPSSVLTSWLLPD